MRISIIYLIYSLYLYIFCVATILYVCGCVCMVYSHFYQKYTCVYKHSFHSESELVELGGQSGLALRACS